MAFDGAFLHKIKQEIDALAGSRVDKISQPDRETIIIVLRGNGGNHKLLLSASAAAAKLHFTKNSIENPKAAPMFCMLLRKHLGSGKLLRTEQEGMDRILTLVFECVNELGDRVELRLVCEIMGRHSNIILTDASGKILDAAKRVDFVTSEVRQILPGITYRLPPMQDKLNPLTATAQQMGDQILSGRDIPLSKGILEQIQGFSPTLCREIAHFVCPQGEQTAANLTEEQQRRLVFYLGVVKTALEPGGGTPVMVRDSRDKPVEFGFLELSQYGQGYTIQKMDSFSAVLDEFYGARDLAERMRQKSADLHKLLGNVRDRLVRKLAAQQQELEQSQDREIKKQWGDIISANLYSMYKGQTVLHTVNFYSPDQEEIDIPLDPMLAPAKNAQRYYNEYRKEATADAKLRELIEKGTQELAYIETVLGELARAETEAELQGIREEAVSQGYLRLQSQASRKPVKLAPRRYRSSDGFLILSGRNNLQNDQLTLREASNYDLWLHTQKIPGSHTIIITDGVREIPQRTIEEAAVIAACNSSARESAKVPVDYTYIKNVRKPRGARPGMVIYNPYQTAIVDPDLKRAEALREK